LWLRTYRFREGPGLQILVNYILPDAAQVEHPEVHDHLARLLVPAHPRPLQPLREHRLAGRLGHAATDRQTQPAITGIVHPTAVTPQIAVRLPKPLPRRLRQAATPVMLRGRAQDVG